MRIAISTLDVFATAPCVSAASCVYRWVTAAASGPSWLTLPEPDFMTISWASRAISFVDCTMRVW